MSDHPPPIVLFDAECVMCDRFVRFCLKRDASGELRFAGLQSEAGQALLQRHRIGPATDSMVLIENDRVSLRSTAALRVARQLTRPWRWAWVFIIVPRPIRDAAYRIVAKLRHRILGRRTTCRVPTPEERGRVIETVADLEGDAPIPQRTNTEQFI